MKYDTLKVFILLSLMVIFSEDRALAQCPSPEESMNAIISIESSASSIPEKIKHFQQLQNSVSTCDTKDSIYARMMHRLGDYYIQTDDFESGIRFTKEAININTQNSPKAQKAFLVHSYYNLGSVYNMLNLYELSHYYYDSCIYLGRKFSQKNFIALMAIESKAHLYYKTGDYHNSLLTARNGMLLSRELKDTLQEALLLCHISYSQFALKQSEEAEKNLKVAINTLIEKKAPVEYIARGYFLLTKNRDNATALSYFKKGIDVNLKQNNWFQCCNDMINLGEFYDSELKDPVNALNCYRKGEIFIKKTNDVYLLAVIYNNMGITYWRQQQFQKALAYYQKALNTLPIHFKDTAIRSNPSHEMLQLSTNDYYISTFLSNKGEALLHQYHREGNKPRLYHALNAFEAADKAVDQMRCNQYNEPSKLFWREKTKKMYENAIEVCYLLNDIKKAFYFFEKSRAVLLNDKLGELGAKKFLPEAKLVQEQNMQYNICVLQKKLSTTLENSSHYNDVQRQLLNAQDEWEQFVKRLETDYPTYYQYKYQNNVLPLDSVYVALRNNRQSLVEYFTGDTTLYILSVSINNSKLIRLPLKDYIGKANEMLKLCSNQSINQHYSRYSVLAHELYQLLFQPLNIPKGRVVISPDELFLPFEALLSKQHEHASFLIKDYAFSYTYSAGFLLRSNVHNQSAENSFLGVAPVDYQSGLGMKSLKGGDESLQQMKNYYDRAVVLTNQQASRKQFLASLPSSTIVQLYSHADADDTGKEPVIYLADSVIYLSEIQELKNVKTEMIVLSACNTGVGKNAKGEGIFSLARAFTAAGIPSTLTTLWKIDSRTTYILTNLFHKYLSQGFTKDEALQNAKLDFLKTNDKKFSLPYFWAANIILGKTSAFHQQKTDHRISFYLVAIGYIIFMGVALGAMYKYGKV